MNFLEKSTNRDKTNILQSEIASIFEVSEHRVYSYLLDFDDTYVYFEIYDNEVGRYYTWRAAYTYNGTTATFADEGEEVVRTTEYVVVERDNDVEKSILGVLQKFFGGSNKTTMPVIEKFNGEQMIAVEPLYITAGTVDGQAETIDLEGVTQLVKSVNDGIASGELKANYFHSVDTEDFHFIKSWVNPVDCIIGDTEVPEGTPLIEVQYVSEKAWALRKEGKLMGLSIEGTADIEEL